MSDQSLAEQVKNQPTQRKKVFFDRYSNEQLLALKFDWQFWGRPKQQLPKLGTWSNWVICAGRGFGKTRTGAESVRMLVEYYGYKRIALIGATVADVRDTMIEGPSGILAVSPPWAKPTYTPSLRKVEWPNGAVAYTYSDEAYEALRGPEHDAGWVDEFCKFRNQEQLWDNYQFGLRVGKNPVTILTTTPKPTATFKAIYKDEETIVTVGTIFENSSNLPGNQLDSYRRKYDGTRIGRQELYAEILEDNPNALFNLDDILHIPSIDDVYINYLRDKMVDDQTTEDNKDKIDKFVSLNKKDRFEQALTAFDSVVIAIDPAGSKHKNSDHTGIVVCGKIGNIGYILEDASMKGSPAQWANKAVELFRTYKANRIIGERNFGGDMVEYTIKTTDKSVPFKSIHAHRGTTIRAEPVSNLYEQHKVYHVGTYSDLEQEMTQWDRTLPKNKQDSPDRMDALVHGITHLLVNAGPTFEAWY